MLAIDTLQALQEFVALRVPESLHLDYKRSDAVGDKSAKEIAKDASAFANADGGRIIYGVLEENHLPTGFDDGVPVRFLGIWFEQVIQQNVRPQIAGLRISEIKSGEGFNYIIIDIPASTYRGAHQAPDKVYYRRHNYRNFPMEDYEIRERMQRSATPHLISDVLLSQGHRGLNLQYTEDAEHSHGIGLQISVTNESEEPCLYSSLRIDIPFDLKVSERPVGFSYDGPGVNVIGDPCHTFRRHLMAPSEMPLFKGIKWIAAPEMKLKYPRKAHDQDWLFVIAHEVIAPRYRLQRITWVQHKGGFLKIIRTDDYSPGMQGTSGLASN
jgi:hypothetical protein